MSTSNTSDPTELERAEGKDPSDKEEDARVGAWQSLIDAAERREKEFRDDGRELVRIYEGDMKDEIPFNILYSNTETLSPALYNNTPRPVVKARYRKSDPVPQASADLTSAFLDFLIDTGDADAPNFDELMLGAIHEALVPGRGLTRWDYDADITFAEEGGKKTPKKVNREGIIGSEVPYDRFCHGYAKTWAKVPWICYTDYLTKEEVKRRWPGKEDEVGYSHDDRDDTERLKDAEGTNLARIHEVWDRTTTKVYFFSEGGKGFLEERDDPYKLTGFFNIPEPLTFVTKISSRTPKALYKLYENQARELNRITLRIKGIIRSVKAVGFYNSLIEGLADVLESEDGIMKPMVGAQALGDGASLDKAVWMWPVERLVTVLQTLMMQRESIKQVIYEVTGISDILRGASVASETATAQNLKSQWGSLRIKRFQKKVARYVKECLRLAAELGFSKLDGDTLFKATATSLPKKSAWNEAKARIDQVQAQAESAQMMAQPGQPPGAPPPQPNPNDIALCAQPIFEDVIDGLKNDLHRKYLVDIEADSTIDVAAGEDKQALSEFLAAMSQLMLGITPMVESGTLPWEAAKAMILTVSRKFRLGRDLDDELSAMVQPAPKPDDAKLKAIQQAQAQLDQKGQALSQQKAQLDAQQQKFQMDQQLAQMKQAAAEQMAQAQAAVQAAMAQVKDVQAKAQLQMILEKIKAESAKQSMQQDAFSNQMANQHQQNMAEHDMAGQRLQNATESSALKLDSKAQKVKAQQQQLAAAKKPTSKA